MDEAGDINGDGLDDIVIGSGAGRGTFQRVSVVFGSTDSSNRNSRFVLFAPIDSTYLGSSVSGAGDINGDGIDDIVVGAPGFRGFYNRPGVSYVVFGLPPSLELIGTNDDDILTGNTGADFISGLAGNDTLQGLSRTDEILGGSGNDLITGGGGNDIVLGQEDNDTISGNTGSDRLNGNEGDDKLSGGLDNDFVFGSSGFDILFGGRGKDSLNGNDGSDRLFGGRGKDSLNGASGDDTLFGGRGNDFLNGNEGNDLLIGINRNISTSEFGKGEQDNLTGGEGNDTFVLANENRVFYDDGDNFTAGDEDFAFISDFDATEDIIQLQGSADLYILDFFASSAGTTNAAIIFAPGATAGEETIAILENVDPNLTLDNPAFTFL